MPNPIIDHIRMNNTVHDIADAQARQDISELNSALDLLTDEIPGTVQEIILDAAGNVAGMTHKKEGVTVRTDAYTKTATTVTETRTLEDGRGIVIETNLETKVTTITEVE